MTRLQPKQFPKWDRHSILAEVRRGGMSLASIETDAGLYQSACRQGLHGMSIPGAEAIAAALNLPFRTLFPVEDGFYPQWERRRAKRNHYQNNNKGSGSLPAVENRETAE